ncbi:MAG: hypothetical protein IJZ84_04140 [Lachnospiraceae bacterium]|nr:hypothetical protein [Lachnospiraceae bacterium]
MEKELLFAKTLEYIKNIAKEQGHIVSKEQVETAFAPLDFGPEQLEMVYEYLRKQKIGIEEAVDPDAYLSEEDVDYLDTYLEELKYIEDATPGEREAITLSAMAGDQDAQTRLIELFLPQVVEIAKLYAGQGAYLEDLIGEGNVALTIGVTMLGALEHASEAEGMLAKMIMDGMEEYIGLSVEQQKEDQKAIDLVNKVSEAARELSEDLRKKITPFELAKETGMELEDIEEAIRLSGDAIEYFEGKNDE